MKYYPYILSEQRLSLLSPEERRQYDFEHSDYCDWGQKEFALQKAQFNKSYNMVKDRYLNEMQNDEGFDDVSEAEMNEMAEQLAIFESEYIMNEVYEILKPMMLENAMTEEEYDKIIEYAKSQLLPSEETLNEATVGPDMSFWMKGLGVTLVPLFSGMAYLLMAGKTQAAIKQLKKYMNKLVEEIDDGTYRKQSMFKKILNRIPPLKFFKSKIAKFFGGPEKIGATDENQSRASFRDMQEMFEGNIACKQMVLMKNIGLLPNDYDQAKKSIENNIFDKGGYQDFLKKIAEPLSALCNKI